MGTKITFAGITSTLAGNDSVRFPAILKILRSGKAVACVQREITDDSLFDAACGFGRGECSARHFADELEEDGGRKSGWRSTFRDGVIIVSCGCKSVKIVEGTPTVFEDKKLDMKKIQAKELEIRRNAIQARRQKEAQKPNPFTLLEMSPDDFRSLRSMN